VVGKGSSRRQRGPPRDAKWLHGSKPHVGDKTGRLAFGVKRPATCSQPDHAGEMLPSLAGLAPASKVSVGSAKAHDSFAQTLRRAAPLLSPTKVQVLVGGHDETRPRNSLGRSPDSRFEDGTVVGRGSASRGIRHTLLRRYYVSYGVRTRIALLGQAAHSRIAGWLTLPRSPTLCLSRATGCDSLQPRPGAELFCSALTSRCSNFRVPSWPTSPGGRG